MADKKISDLNSYTNYKYTGDNLLIVDAQNSETKKIDASAFFNNISGNVQCSGNLKTNSSSDAGGPNDDTASISTAGGAAILRQLHVGNDANLYSNLTAYGNTTLKQNLHVTGNITGAELDVSGIIKSNRINVNQGKLYVDNGAGNEFVKIGAYGTGSFFGTPGSNNGTVYTLGVGVSGKIIESERVTTSAISGSGYLNLNTKPKALINAPGSGKIILPTEVYILQSYNSGDPANHLTNRTGAGDWNQGNVPAFTINSFQSGFSGAKNIYAKFTKFAASKKETFVSYKSTPSTDHDIAAFFNRPVCISAPSQNEFTNMNQVPGGIHFIKIKYSILEGDADFREISNLKVINENILGTGTWTFNATS